MNEIGNFEVWGYLFSVVYCIRPRGMRWGGGGGIIYAPDTTHNYDYVLRGICISIGCGIALLCLCEYKVTICKEPLSITFKVTFS